MFKKKKISFHILRALHPTEMRTNDFKEIRNVNKKKERGGVETGLLRAESARLFSSFIFFTFFLPTWIVGLEENQIDYISFHFLLSFHLTYRHVGHGDSVIHINGHLRFLDWIEIGAVDREEAAARGEAPQRLDLHDGRVFGVTERILGQDAFSVVDRHRQLGDSARAGCARTGAQEPSSGRVTAVHQAGQFVEEGRNAAAHVEVEARDGEQRAATLRSECWEHAVQFQVLERPKI